MRMNGELEAELLEAKIGVVELAEAEAKAHETATRTTLELHAKKSALRLAVVEEAASHEADLAARQEATAAAVDETRARAEEWQRTAAAAEAEKDMADREDVRAHAQVEKPAACHACCPRVTHAHVSQAEKYAGMSRTPSKGSSKPSPLKRQSTLETMMNSPEQLKFATSSKGLFASSPGSGQ